MENTLTQQSEAETKNNNFVKCNLVFLSLKLPVKLLKFVVYALFSVLCRTVLTRTKYSENGTGALEN